MFFRTIIILIYISLHCSALDAMNEITHGDYSQAYKSDWSTLPSGKFIPRKALSDFNFKTVIGDNVKKEYIDKELVHLTDIAYRVNWKGQYNKYRNALFLIRGCIKVNIENIAIIQKDSDYRASHSILIEDCKEVYLRSSYFSGSCRNYHIKIEGCEKVFIDNVEICGFDYGEKGFRCGGGILINNGDPKQGGIHGMLSPNPSNLSWCVIQNCFIHDNLDADEKRNLDGINLLSASDGIVFNCFFENWNKGDAALDISHRRKDSAYINKFYRVERNIYKNCKRVKTPGNSHNSCKLFFANNIYLNVHFVDYHQGWDVYHIHETFVYENVPSPIFFYTLQGVNNGHSYLTNCLINVEGKNLKSVYFQKGVYGPTEYKALKADFCVYAMPLPGSWLRGPEIKITTWKDWQKANDYENNSIMTSDDVGLWKFEKRDYRLTSGSSAASYGSGDYLITTDKRMTVDRDFNGKIRPKTPSAGAFEVYEYDALTAPNNVTIKTID